MTGTEIAAIAGGIGTIIAAIGIPKIAEALGKYRASRDAKVVELSEKLAATEQKLNELEIKLSLILPIIAKKNASDPDIMHLLSSVIDVSDIHTTPAPNEKKKWN